MNCHLKVLSALVFCAWNLPVLALDLGRLQVHSAIGEPLRAEIEIAQASPEELRSLRAQLASPASFLQAGMEFNPALAGLTAALQTRSNGVPYIALNGRAPVQESFIDLILETQWASGRLVKNYALLLSSVNERANNPSPFATSSAPAQLAIVPASPAFRPVAQGSTVRSSDGASALNPSSVEFNAQRVPVYRFDPVDNTPARPKAEAPSAATTSSARPLRAPAVLAESAFTQPPQDKDEGQVTVKHGDTASRLAMRYLASHVSLDQMLLAMLKANPDAFIDGNVNLIKAGAKLRIPAADEATQITRSEARQTVIAQTRDFAEYARRLAESPLVVGSKNSRAMSGKVATEVLDADAKSPQQDKLTLSKSNVNASNAEAKLAAEREAQDAAEQLAALNKNLKDLQALAQTSPMAIATAAPAVDTPPTPASRPPLETAGTHFSSSLNSLGGDKQIWPWAVGLLAATLFLVAWVRRKSRAPEDVYAPSYNDPLPPSGTSLAGQASPDRADIPPQMASIDLNLDPQRAVPTHTATDAFAPSASAPHSKGATDDTEQSKLNLAEQLLGKGDQDLARALILSVAASATGDLKSRALHLLGQIR